MEAATVAADAWMRAAEAAALLTATLGICVLLRPGWIGRGDVKYGVAIGASVGWVSWFAVYAAVLVATSLGAIIGIGLILSRRASLRSRVPLGPFMFAGAVITIAVLRGL